MEAVLQNQEDDTRLKYWLQLDLIFKAAVKAGILDRNPVQYIIASVSKRATDRQREIRNAMTKKNLETDEENRLLELLSAPAQNPQDGQSKLPLYVINSKAIVKIEQMKQSIKRASHYQPYAESTIQTFRRLIRVVVKIAAENNLCDDILWGTVFADTESDDHAPARVNPHTTQTAAPRPLTTTRRKM